MDQAKVDQEIRSCYHTKATPVANLGVSFCDGCLDTEYKRVYDHEIFLRKLTGVMQQEILSRRPPVKVTILPPGPMPGTRRKPTFVDRPKKEKPVKNLTYDPSNAKHRAAWNNLVALGIAQ